MTRIKRWLNMHGDKFNADGTLKTEVAEKMKQAGSDSSAIARYAAIYKAEFDEWQRLDETDPEVEHYYTAWDLFSPQDQKRFLPDGTLQPEYIDELMQTGVSRQSMQRIEELKIIEVENFNRVSKYYRDRGINWGEELIAEQNSPFQEND